MPFASSGDSTICSLPTPKVVEAIGMLLFMPAAALILSVVEIERLELVEHRADDLPRGGRDAAMHDCNFVFKRSLLSELGVELHARLGVVVDELKLAAQQSTRSVGFLDGERENVDHGLAIDVEPARKVVQAANLDGVGRESGSAQSTRAGQTCRGPQELPAVDIHISTPFLPPRYSTREAARRA